MAKKRGFSLAALFGDNDAKQDHELSLIHISEPTRPAYRSRMPSSA